MGLIFALLIGVPIAIAADTFIRRKRGGFLNPGDARIHFVGIVVLVVFLVATFGPFVR